MLRDPAILGCVIRLERLPLSFVGLSFKGSLVGVCVLGINLESARFLGSLGSLTLIFSLVKILVYFEVNRKEF